MTAKAQAAGVVEVGDNIFGEELATSAESKCGMPRRRFGKMLTIGGLAAMAGGLAVFFRARLSGSFPPRVVAGAEEIPVGGSKIFTYPTDVEPCILLRLSEDAYVAYSRLCTHASCPLFYHAGAKQLDCPCHGGSFSVDDGSVLQGPPPRPLPKIVLEKRGSEIFAVGVAKS
jgi:Rieske Fe-S protein